MKLPKISIVIPSCNKARYIEETISSIVSQNYPNIELIIEDGGSTDGTVGIIDNYAKKYPFIIWKSKKDKGQTDAVNRGLHKATGDILTFINADDIYSSGALIKVGEYFRDHPQTGWLAGKGKIIDEKGNETSRFVSSYKNWLLNKSDIRLLLMVNYLVQPTVFLSKEVWQKHGGFTGVGKWIMEYEMWLKLGREQMPAVINRSLASFRLTKGSASANDFMKILKADDKIAESFTKNPFILVLHYLHNIARIITLFAFND